MPKKTRRRSESKSESKSIQKQVDASYLPAEQKLKRERRTSRRDTREQMRRTRRSYGALDDSLALIGRQGKRGYRNARTGLASGMAGLSGLLGLGGSEMQSRQSGNVFGSIGARGMADIGNIQGRDQAWTSSSRRQGAIESNTLQRQYQYELSRNLRELREQMMDLQAQKSAEMSAAMAEQEEADRQAALVAQWIRSMKNKNGNGQGNGQQQPDPTNYTGSFTTPFPQGVTAPGVAGVFGDPITQGSYPRPVVPQGASVGPMTGQGIQPDMQNYEAQWFYYYVNQGYDEATARQMAQMQNAYPAPRV